jgi:hypothetical protein
MPKWHFQLGLGAFLAGMDASTASNLIDALNHDAVCLTHHPKPAQHPAGARSQRLRSMGTLLDRHHRAGRSPRTPKMPAKTYGAFLIKEGILASWGILAAEPSPCDRRR